MPARGLHGEAYRGHVFWDELFVLPVLTLRAAALTRASLRYRYRRLPAARRAARDAGFAGAMYPWQSGSDGSEDSQRLHLNRLSGRCAPDVSHLQRHVCHAVAYTTWQYYQSTGDVAFLVDHGAEMILEIARFWSSAASYDRGRDRFVIRGVMGSDEFHTCYPGADNAGIDHNAYGRRGQFTHCIDIAPTILGVAGIPEARLVDGIEQGRRTVEQHNIPQMQVAMTFPNAAARRTCSHQRAPALPLVVRPSSKRIEAVAVGSGVHQFAHRD